MDTEQLRTFVVLEQQRNFTRTANQLFVAQSTVTNRISELEKAVGKALVKRSKKDIQLTAEGEIFLDYAKKMLELEARVLGQLASTEQQPPLVRIGTTNSLYDLFVEQATVRQLQSKALRFHIRFGRSLDLLSLLQHDRLDVVYSYLPFHHKDYACHLLAEDSLVLVTNANNRCYEDGISLQQLASIDYLHCDFPVQEIENTMRILFPKHHSFLLEIDNTSKLLHYLVQGIGYTLLPKSTVAPLLAEQQLRVVPLLDYELPVIQYFQVYELRKTPLLREFLGHE